VAERRGELVLRVAQHELQIQLLDDPSIGWIASASMHTPTTTIRVPRGAAAMI